LLLDSSSASTMCDNNGQTPLHRACLRGGLAIVELLLLQEQQGGVEWLVKKVMSKLLSYCYKILAWILQMIIIM
jgi:hypothetical protein